MNRVLSIIENKQIDQRLFMKASLKLISNIKKFTSSLLTFSFENI